MNNMPLHRLNHSSIFKPHVSVLKQNKFHILKPSPFTTFNPSFSHAFLKTCD